MNYFEIEGAVTKIKVFANQVEETAMAQLYKIASHSAFAGSKIRIMPDVHAGKGAVIGFTATISDKVCPNLVGVDIGCGVSAYNIYEKPDFKKLDQFIRDNIPSGHSVHTDDVVGTSAEDDFMEKVCAIAREIEGDAAYYRKSLGTLGSGNHFLSIEQVDNDNCWFLIHTGSRKFGKDVADYHWKKAKRLGNHRSGELDLAWLDGKDAEEYLAHMKVAQQYAKLNRSIIANIVLHYLGIDSYHTEKVESVHNYIDFGSNPPIIRKGAISALHGERMVIPFNMADGSILGRGKGVEDWNFSAPHGAGRKMARGHAKRKLRLEDYEKRMQGVWSSCVSEKTLDESPMAYKPYEEILESIKDTVEVTHRLKPVYNFKAS